jgi:hypothetical protein
MTAGAGRARRAAWLAAGALAVAPAAEAHRLDEYLQAARIGIDRGRIEVEIDLTPGALVAPQIAAGIDTNRDGAISGDEADTYARLVLAAVRLELDDRPQPLVLVERGFPDLEAMGEGVGVIRLRAASRVGSTARGRHRLIFHNGHRPEMGVYLANALTPADASVAIEGQHRDVLQRELRIDYRIGSPWVAPLSWSAIAIAAIAGLIGIRRRTG